jgi:hypothetical protein
MSKINSIVKKKPIPGGGVATTRGIGFKSEYISKFEFRFETEKAVGWGMVFNEKT